MPRAAVVALLVVTAVTAGAASSADERANKSPALVKQLVDVMTQQNLTAIAAKQPDAPDRYLAAMLFPKVQLLVIGARTSAVSYVEWQIAARKLRRRVRGVAARHPRKQVLRPGHGG